MFILATTIVFDAQTIETVLKEKLSGSEEMAEEIAGAYSSRSFDAKEMVACKEWLLNVGDQLLAAKILALADIVIELHAQHSPKWRDAVQLSCAIPQCDYAVRFAYRAWQSGDTESARGIASLVSMANGVRLYIDAQYLLGVIALDDNAPEVVISHFNRALLAERNIPEGEPYREPLYTFVIKHVPGFTMDDYEFIPEWRNRDLINRLLQMKPAAERDGLLAAMDFGSTAATSSFRQSLKREAALHSFGEKYDFDIQASLALQGDAERRMFLDMLDELIALREQREANT